MKSHPPGTIGVCANDTSRFTIFTASLAGIQSPEGSQIAWAMGSDIVNGRNLLVEERMVGDWIWFMDDDHAFAPDLLMQLLNHQVDVVVPVCLMRQKPFYPVDLIAEQKAIDLTTAPTSGLIELYAAGTAGMLIRRSVFKKYREHFAGHPVFEKETDVSEDLVFCRALRELGIPIHCDLGARLGHVTTTVIWPDEIHDLSGDSSRWCVGFQVSDSYLIQVGIEPPE